MAKDRKPAEVERDRRNIARLYLQGMVQAEIAHELKISQPTVSREIKTLVTEWRQERVYDINEAKAKELAKLDVLEVEYWEAWRRSQGETEKTTSGSMVGGSVRYSVTETQVGDPRFLDGVFKCIKGRCEILGVEAPKEVGITPETIVKFIEIAKSKND